MSGKSFPISIGTVVCLISLTFAIPATQWFATKLIAYPEFSGSVSSVSIILTIGLLCRKQKTIRFQLPSLQRKIFYLIALTVILGLLVFNIQNQPVAKITGRSRTPLEVFDLIVLLPVAEELIFRGVIWSKLEKISPAHLPVLAGSSFLFGIEHLGYWAQSNWPLPLDAYLHAFSMIFAGLFFGYFRLKSDSLTIPAVLHMLANGAILLTQ